MHQELNPRVYEILTHGIVQDLSCYANIALQYKGPILDLGAGLGRISIPLLEAGHHVVLLDNNPNMCMEMVNRLSNFSKETLQRVWILKSDMTERSTLAEDQLQLGSAETLPTKFSLVIIGLRTIHLFDEKERNSIFTLARNSLQVGGLFILHYSDLAQADEKPYWTLVAEHPLEFGTIEVEECFLFHPITQRYHLRHRIWQSNETGQHIGSWRVAHNLLPIEQQALIEELREQGFENIETQPLYGTESFIIAKL